MGLALASPALLVFAVLTKLTSPGPVLYRGIRVGLNGKQFPILKFRTMVVNADKLGGPTTSADDPRVTAIGGFLRRFKLDELPQLLNVLRGDMSLVGPRPEVASEVEQYSAEARQLLSVRPGITDYASIKFRNEGEIVKGYADPHEAYKRLIQPEKIRLGLEYVKTNSFLGDMKILFATLKAVLLG